MIWAIAISLLVGFGLGFWAGKQGPAAVVGDVEKAASETASEVEKKV